MNQGIVRLLLASSLLAVPCAAAANAADTAGWTSEKPLGSALEGEAKEAYQAARLLFTDGDFAGAYAKFRHAHELSGDPRLLWNLAVCEKERRRYTRASRLIERYLEEGGARLPEETRRNAEGVLATLRSFWSIVVLDGAPRGALVLVDGDEVGRTPLSEPLHLDLGSHRLRIEAPGYEPFVQTLDVPGNVDIEVNVFMKETPTMARLALVTGPRHTIFLDNRVVGEERWEGDLTPGRHHLRITAPGKKAYDRELELAPKTTQSLRIMLEDESSGATLWPWLVGGSVLLAGAAAGGYFLLSDRSRHADGPSGSLGSVQLPLLGSF